MWAYAQLVISHQQVDRDRLSQALSDPAIPLPSLEDLQARTKLEEQQVKFFVDALGDAFTMDEVAEHASCLLAEVGYCDDYPGLEGAWVWVVSLKPEASTCFVVRL